MKAISGKITSVFIWSMFATICLPIGVIMIIFGASKGITPMLVIGIVAAVFGFYGAPMFWMRYGSLKGLKSLVAAVENDNLYSVAELSSVLGCNEDETRNRIRAALAARYITGFTFVDDRLVVNTNVKQANVGFTIRCDNCGAPVVIDPKKADNRCEYCGKIFRNITPPAKQ